MDYYLPTTITASIYRYISWFHLKSMSTVPNYIWKIIYDDHQTNVDFQQKYSLYKNTTTRSYRTLFLSFVNQISNCAIATGSFTDIPKILCREPGFILLMIQYHTKFENLIQYAPMLLRSNKYFMRTCAERSIYTLQYMDASLRNDLDFMWNLLDIDGYALRYARSDLKMNREFVWKAVQNNHRVLFDLGYIWRHDPDIALEAVKQDSTMINNLPPQLRNDRNFILKLLNSNCNIYSYAASTFPYDHEILLTIIKHSWDWIIQFPVAVRSNKQFMLAAMRCDIRVYMYADSSLKLDPAFRAAIVECANPIIY